MSKFDIGMTVDTPLGRGKIIQLNGRGDYFVQIGPEGFACLGGEWFSKTEIEHLPVDDRIKFPTSDDFLEDYQGL